MRQVKRLYFANAREAITIDILVTITVIGLARGLELAFQLAASRVLLRRDGDAHAPQMTARI